MLPPDMRVLLELIMAKKEPMVFDAFDDFAQGEFDYASFFEVVSTACVAQYKLVMEESGAILEEDDADEEEEGDEEEEFVDQDGVVEDEEDEEFSAEDELVTSEDEDLVDEHHKDFIEL